MRIGSALLHRWSAALEEYDFTVCHRPGKAQTHADGFSRLPVGLASPEDTLLHVQVDTEEEARRLAAVAAFCDTFRQPGVVEAVQRPIRL